jgi:pSer/pThr/pTyr-binding forkhead associated (FHA) protein
VNEVVIDNVGVSRHHATLSLVGDRFVLSDEGSANGVFVNGKKIEERELLDGDVVQIGKFLVNFTRQQDQPIAELGPASAPMPRSREMMRTFAMNETQVKDLLGGGQGASAPPPAAVASTSSGINPTWLLAGGLAAIAALTTVAALVLF